MKAQLQFWLGVAVVFPLGPTYVRAEVFRDAANHFQFEIPIGWVKMTDAELTMMNNVAGRIGGGIRYDAGLRQQNTLPGSYPYILVQIHKNRMSGATYEDIENALSRELNAPIQQVKEVLKDLIKDVAVGQLAVDRQRNRVLIRAQLDMPVGKVLGISQGHLGSEGIVYIHSYAFEQDFDKYLPKFNQLSDSFRYDTGYAFVPRTSFAFLEGAKKGIVPGVIGGTVAGGLVGVVVVVVRRFKKPKNRKRKRARDELDDTELAT